MSLKAEIAKNNMIFTGGNITAALLSFVFSVLIARLLQPEQFGFFSFAFIVSGFFMIFIDLGISSTLVKFMSGYLENGEKSRAGSLIRFLFKFRVCMALIVGFFMFVFSEWISVFVFSKPDGQPFVVMASGILFANALFDFVNSVLLGFKKFKHIVGLRIFERVVKIVLSVGLVLSGFRAFGAVSGVVLSFLLVSLIGFVFLRKHNDVLKSSGPAFEKRKLLSFGFWVLVGSFIASLYTMTDALLVSMLRSVEEVGFYSIGISWMALITYVVPISSVVMYPYFSSFDKSKNFEALQNSIKYALITALPLAAIMSAFSPWIISIFYGQPYAASATSLSLLSFVAVTLIISPLIMGYFYGIGKPKAHTAVLSSVFIINIAVSYFLINMFGIRGAAVGMLFSRLIEISVFFIILSLVMRLGFKWENILKPAITSLLIYIVAVNLVANNILELATYGSALLASYFAMMIAIGGIEKKDIRIVLDWIGKILKR